MLGSPDHVALRLRKWRLTTKQTVLGSYAATVALGAPRMAMSAASPRGGVDPRQRVVVVALGRPPGSRPSIMSL
jgi:hypothetical protein